MSFKQEVRTKVGGVVSFVSSIKLKKKKKMAYGKKLSSFITGSRIKPLDGHIGFHTDIKKTSLSPSNICDTKI